MKIISIGFKNPFHDSGYTNTIKIAKQALKEGLAQMIKSDYLY